MSSLLLVLMLLLQWLWCSGGVVAVVIVFIFPRNLFQNVLFFLEVSSKNGPELCCYRDNINRYFRTTLPVFPRQIIFL